jgi:hypothetical protein
MPNFLSMFWTIMLLSQAHFAPTATMLGTEPASVEEQMRVNEADSLAFGSADSVRFDTGRAATRVRFGSEDIPYRVMAVFALPGEEVPIEVAGATADARLEASAGTLQPLGDGRWGWRAPATVGTTTIHVQDGLDPTGVTLHAFVMVPYGEMRNGSVRGYRIGAYPTPRASRTHEARPRGFVQVTAENADLQVSPHFRLGQFVCKEGGAGFPKYVVLQQPLLLRLEDLLASVNERGIEASTFQVMSAYRTPWYNRAIGNTTSFTRHQYGDAADIFVDDLPADGRMDDLNRDGRHDRNDAMVLRGIAEETEGRPEAGGREGGLSAYAPNDAHGAFVHVDTRGYEARW